MTQFAQFKVKRKDLTLKKLQQLKLNKNEDDLDDCFYLFFQFQHKIKSVCLANFIIHFEDNLFKPIN